MGTLHSQRIPFAYESLKVFRLNFMLPFFETRRESRQQQRRRSIDAMRITITRWHVIVTFDALGENGWRRAGTMAVPHVGIHNSSRTALTLLTRAQRPFQVYSFFIPRCASNVRRVAGCVFLLCCAVLSGWPEPCFARMGMPQMRFNHARVRIRSECKFCSLRGAQRRGKRYRTQHAARSARRRESLQS